MAYPPIKRLRFPTGTSQSQRSFNRDEIISSLNQQIIDLKKRVENIEPKVSADSSYEGGESFDMEKEMEMEE